MVWPYVTVRHTGVRDLGALGLHSIERVPWNGMDAEWRLIGASVDTNVSQTGGFRHLLEAARKWLAKKI
jgi:hypothetical protein